MTIKPSKPKRRQLNKNEKRAGDGSFFMERLGLCEICFRIESKIVVKSRIFLLTQPIFCDIIYRYLA